MPTLLQADPERVITTLSAYIPTPPSSSPYLAAMLVPCPCIIRTVLAWVTTGGAGAGAATQLDVVRNGASVWKTSPSYISIPRGYAGRVTVPPPDVREYAAGDYLQLVAGTFADHLHVMLTVALERP